MLAVVTNIDADHMETYGHDFAQLKRAFVDFLQRLPFYGVAVSVHGRAERARDHAGITKPIVTYGLADDAQTARDRRRPTRRPHALRRARARARADLADRAATCRRAQRAERAGRDRGRRARWASPTRRSPRRWRNSAASAGASSATARSRSTGGGTFTLIDDYGHHPAEMAATLAAARASFPGRRLVLAFQPHRYTRTRDLFEDFVRVLSTVDALLLADVYPAGEAPIVAADGRALARAVRVAGKVEPVFVEKIADMPAAIRTLRARRRRGGDDGRRIDRQRAARSCRNDDARAPPIHRPARQARAQTRRCAQLHELARRRAGGRALLPADRDDLAAFLRQLPADEPLTVLGLGSNTAGARRRRARHGDRACTTAAPRSRSRDGLVYAEAGVASPKLARFAAMHGLRRGGVPRRHPRHGRRRAGDERRLLRRRDLALRRARRGADARRPVRSCARRPITRSATAACAGRWLALRTASSRRRGSAFRRATAARRGRGSRSCWRSASRPSRSTLPNAGSVFRNPAGRPCGAADRGCGLKGYAIGGARVSEKHANFIVNPGGAASAADIEALIAHVRDTVRAKTGVDLEPEVRIIGEAA